MFGSYVEILERRHPAPFPRGRDYEGDEEERAIVVAVAQGEMLEIDGERASASRQQCVSDSPIPHRSMEGPRPGDELRRERAREVVMRRISDESWKRESLEEQMRVNEIKRLEERLKEKDRMPYWQFCRLSNRLIHLRGS